MKRELFNDGWVFYASGGTSLENTVSGTPEPKSVKLPHDAMIAQKRDPHNPTGNATGYYPYRTVHYMKDFEVKDASEEIFLEFDGVYMNTAVYINGTLAAQHINGYTSFTVHITPYLRQGKNTVKVLVRNGVPSSRWYTGTGIYRDVYLLSSGQIHIAPNGVRISTIQADSNIAVLRVETTLFNRENKVSDLVLRHEIEDSEVSVPVTLLPGEEKTVTARIELERPRLWSLDTPELYVCKTDLVGLDHEITRFGVCTLSLDSKHGLRINGETVKLRGGCVHHDHGVVGAVEHRSLEERRIRKLKEAGYNAVRCAHCPASKTLLEICDEVGMLVMNELCDAWTQPKVDFDYSAWFTSHWEADCEAMVQTSFNHPSVIFYSIGNEICEVSNKFETQYGRRIADKLRSLDPSRYVTNCVNIALSVIDRLPELAVRAGADINTIMNGNMTELIRLMATKEVGSPLEEAFSYLDAAGYNYAPYRYSTDIESYPGRIIIGSESYPAALYDNWALCEKLPQVIGDFGWSVWDYIGEAGVGQHHYGETSDFDLYGAYPWKTANCGDFDLIGDRRPISYWREIVWGLRMAPYICVQDPMHFGEKQSPTRWGWSDAIRSWNWRGFEGKPIAVEVYSNADEVELFYNGRSVDIKTPTKCKAVFETVYAPGTLTAVSRRNHVETGKDALMTASYDVHIKWERKGRGIIEISVVDESGLLNPDADMDVHIENDVEILGFGSADPKSEENYFDRTIKTYKGRALLVMREGEESNGYNEGK